MNQDTRIKIQVWLGAIMFPVYILFPFFVSGDALKLIAVIYLVCLGLSVLARLFLEDKPTWQ